MLKGILFDLDGTLIDSLGLTFDALNYGISRVGQGAKTRAEIAQQFGKGELQMLEALVGQAKAGEAYHSARAYLRENMSKVPLHPGVTELLEQIRAAGIPTSIVTGRSWNTTELILDHHGLHEHFVTVIASDHVQSSKPHPEGLHLALGRMNLDPSHAMYVGDSAMDMGAAHGAGTLAVAAVWDQTAERLHLESQKPHHFAEHPREIWALWEKLTRL